MVDRTAIKQWTVPFNTIKRYLQASFQVAKKNRSRTLVCDLKISTILLWRLSSMEQECFFFIYLLVALKHRRGDEGLLTQVALVLLVAIVYHLDVDIERVLPLEGGVALVALKCPLTWGVERRGKEERGEEHFVRGSFHCREAVNTRSSQTAGAEAICRLAIEETKRQTTTKLPLELFLLCVSRFTTQEKNK